MDFNPVEIQDLTMDEIAGVITEAEKEHLYQVIAENQEAFAIWQKLHENLGSKQLAEAKESMHVDPTLIIKRASRHRRNVNLVKIFSLVALIVLIAVNARHLFTISREPIAQKDLITSLSDRQIQLKLVNGQTINLSGDSQQVRIGSMTIYNQGKTLHYTGKQKPVGLNTLTVPVGKDYNIVLSDNTEIQLNSASSITFPLEFKGSAREITIQGEAYVKVAPNSQQPFLVHLPDGNLIKVLGTSFNVNAYEPQKMQVALVEGSVRVLQAGKDSILLKPGYAAISSDNKLAVKKFDTDEVLSWRKGIYEFSESDALENVCKVLPRWFGITVVMDNSETGKKKYLGVIDRNAPLESFLKNLQAVDPSISYYFDDKGTLHFK